MENEGGKKLTSISSAALIKPYNEMRGAYITTEESSRGPTRTSMNKSKISGSVTSRDSKQQSNGRWLKYDRQVAMKRLMILRLSHED